MHTPYRSVQPTAGIRQPHGSRTSPNAKPLGVPWDWIRSSRVAVARTRYSNNKSTIQALLRQRIKKMTPSDHIHWQATAFSTRGNTISAMHPQPMHVPPASELRWPEHAPVLLAGLSMPIAHSMQRSALRPLLAASAACIAQSPPGATQTGHWVALLDLTSSSLAAMSQKHHSTAEALVATACEELQAQVSVLSAHHVTSSVLLLGEILTKQVCAHDRKYIENCLIETMFRIVIYHHRCCGCCGFKSFDTTPLVARLCFPGVRVDDCHPTMQYVSRAES